MFPKLLLFPNSTHDQNMALHRYWVEHCSAVHTPQVIATDLSGMARMMRFTSSLLPVCGADAKKAVPASVGHLRPAMHSRYLHTHAGRLLVSLTARLRMQKQASRCMGASVCKVQGGAAGAHFWRTRPPKLWATTTGGAGSMATNCATSAALDCRLPGLTPGATVLPPCPLKLNA